MTEMVYYLAKNEKPDVTFQKHIFKMAKYIFPE